MNILLVDDQERILVATKSLVNWERLKVDEVYTADSTEAARQILKAHAIDIMLTDIEMPGEDGIALQKWQAEHYPYVYCIFLTSHAEFAYAKEAIHNGAFDYILQPASPTDIEDALSRCIKRLKERELLLKKSSNSLETYLVAMFYQRGRFDQMEQWRTDSLTQGDAWRFVPCLMEFEQTKMEDVRKLLPKDLELLEFNEKRVAYIFAPLNDQHIAIVFYAEKDIDLTKLRDTLELVRAHFCKELCCPLTFFLGKSAGEDLPDSVESIMEYQEQMVYEKNEIYIVGGNNTYELRVPDGAAWGKWLIRKDSELVKNQITNLLHYASKQQYLTVNYMRQVIHSFLEACTVGCYAQNKKLTELFTDDFTYEKMLHSYNSVTELCEGVDRCLRQYNEILARQGEEEGPSSVHERIQEVLRYLDENMERMISRREAAKYIFLNEDYFSRTFRKETGMGYKEYVLKQKMAYAKKLLENTDMSVALIASKVGYDNFTNFTQMFRKTMGFTPRECRKKYKKS